MGTVELMRKTLRNLIKLGREGRSMEYPSHPFSFKEDTTALQQNLTEIEAVITDYVGSDTTCEKKIDF